ILLFVFDAAAWFGGIAACGTRGDVGDRFTVAAGESANDQQALLRDRGMRGSRRGRATWPRAGGGWIRGCARWRCWRGRGRGRVGVAVLDTLTDARFGQRADERFPMCSTFKLLAAAAILARVDAGEERLDRRVRFGAGEVVVNSPITKDRLSGEGMTLAELCE